MPVTLISDRWKLYNCLHSQGFLHLLMTHKYNFVYPDTGVYMRNIERLCREVQSTAPRDSNCKHHLHGHLADFIIQTTQYLFVTYLLLFLAYIMEQALKKNTLMKLVHMTVVYQWMIVYINCCIMLLMTYFTHI